MKGRSGLLYFWLPHLGPERAIPGRLYPVSPLELGFTHVCFGGNCSKIVSVVGVIW